MGVHQCLIPLSKGEGCQPNFPLDFSLPKIKRMFTVEVDHYALKELKVDFNEKHQEITQDQWKKYVIDSIACTISIAECEPEG